MCTVQLSKYFTETADTQGGNGSLIWWRHNMIESSSQLLNVTVQSCFWMDFMKRFLSFRLFRVWCYINSLPPLTLQ